MADRRKTIFSLGKGRSLEDKQVTENQRQQGLDDTRRAQQQNLAQRQAESAQRSQEFAMNLMANQQAAQTQRDFQAGESGLSREHAGELLGRQQDFTREGRTAEQARFDKTFGLEESRDARLGKQSAAELALSGQRLAESKRKGDLAAATGERDKTRFGWETERRPEIVKRDEEDRAALIERREFEKEQALVAAAQKAIERSERFEDRREAKARLDAKDARQVAGDEKEQARYDQDVRFKSLTMAMERQAMVDAKAGMSQQISMQAHQEAQAVLQPALTILASGDPIDDETMYELEGRISSSHPVVRERIQKILSQPEWTNAIRRERLKKINKLFLSPIQPWEKPSSEAARKLFRLGGSAPQPSPAPQGPSLEDVARSFRSGG
jgi:hypothetical protein